MKTTMSIALTVRSAISENNLKPITMNDMVEYYNTLAPHVFGCQPVTKFKNKAVGIKSLESLIGAVEVRGGINFSGDPTCMADPIRGSRKKVGVAGAKAKRVSCMVRVDGSAPALVSQVKVSSFKAAEKITLSCTPSEPQRKYLVNMGVWENVTVLSA